MFVNSKEGKVMHLIFHELVHKKPSTPIHCDNTTATGIANNTVKKQRSRSMEMIYFWIADQVQWNFFSFHWHPGQEILADYFSKHFPAFHHHRVHPYYIHENNSPLILPRALAPKALRGCVGSIPGGYRCSAPLLSLIQNPAPSWTSDSTPAAIASILCH